MNDRFEDADKAQVLVKLSAYIIWFTIFCAYV